MSLNVIPPIQNLIIHNAPWRTIPNSKFKTPNSDSVRRPLNCNLSVRLLAVVVRVSRKKTRYGTKKIMFLLCNSKIITTFALALKKQGWLPEWPNGADCKSAGYAFGGSNPSPPTS